MIYTIKNLPNYFDHKYGYRCIPTKEEKMEIIRSVHELERTIFEIAKKHTNFNSDSVSPQERSKISLDFNESTFHDVVHVLIADSLGYERPKNYF